jgi:predicted transcriptional regulator
MLDRWTIEFIKNNKIKQKELAKIWNISEAAVSYKINGLARISVQDISAILRRFPSFTDFLISKLSSYKETQNNLLNENSNKLNFSGSNIRIKT